MFPNCLYVTASCQARDPKVNKSSAGQGKTVPRIPFQQEDREAGGKVSRDFINQAEGWVLGSLKDPCPSDLCPDLGSWESRQWRLEMEIALSPLLLPSVPCALGRLSQQRTIPLTELCPRSHFWSLSKHFWVPRPQLTPHVGVCRQHP